jgi:hypothetical protein
VASSDCEIVGRNRPYEKWVQCGPNSWLMETGAICTPFVAGEPRPSFFSAISRTSSVALFQGSDSGSKNVAFFLESRRERKIIASEALNSESSFRSPQFKPYSGASDLQQEQMVDFGCGSENSPAKGSSGSSSPALSCANTSSEGEQCMKDTDHPIRHPSVHPRLSGRVRSQRGCAGRNDQFGHGQNTGLGWSDPTFAHVSVPKVVRGVAPAQLRGDRAEYFVRVQIGETNHTQDRSEPLEFENRTSSRKRRPQSCRVEMKTTPNF